jgi:hypothetical protein
VSNFAVLQKIEHRSKRSRLCLRIDPFPSVLILGKFGVVLLFNGGQFGLQYLQGFQSVHRVYASPAFSSAESYWKTDVRAGFVLS